MGAHLHGLIIIILYGFTLTINEGLEATCAGDFGLPNVGKTELQ